MSLTDSEIRRIKYELGANLLTFDGAAPYVGTAQIFENVIQDNLTTGAETTSATAVTAATSPTPSTLVLTSATGFAAGVRVIIDVDSRRESATIGSLAGTSMTVLLTKAHSGTYSVAVESGETIVRECLHALTGIGEKLGLDASGIAISAAGIKKVDEIVFKDGISNTPRHELLKIQDYWRTRLGLAIGYPYQGQRAHAGHMIAV